MPELEVSRYYRRRGMLTKRTIQKAVVQIVLHLRDRARVDEFFDALSNAGIEAFADTRRDSIAYCPMHDCTTSGAAVWFAMVEHLFASGALSAALRHALDAESVELPAPQKEHLTAEEISAVVMCSDVVPPGVARTHLPQHESVRITAHAEACDRCYLAYESAIDVAALTANGARQAAANGATTP